MALRTFSLLEKGTEDQCYQIHGVIQDVLRIQRNSLQQSLDLLNWALMVERYFNDSKTSFRRLDESKVVTLEPHLRKTSRAINNRAIYRSISSR